MSEPDRILTQAREFISRARWQYAWSVPARFHPHSYTLRDRAREAGIEPEFEWLVLAIRAHGYDDRFGRRTFRYLEVEADGIPWRLWTMGNELAATTVINREDLKRKAERAARKAARHGAQLRLDMEVER
jgi:hypothetical protein